MKRRKERMFDYSKKDFYSRVDNTTGDRKFYIKINGNFMEVSREVYYVFYNSYRKDLRDYKAITNLDAISLNQWLNDEHELIDLIGIDVNYIGDIYLNDLIEELLRIINQLDLEEKELIVELLINEKKERELAQEYQVA